MLEVEQERTRVRLAEFRRFNPPRFSGHRMELYEVETWVKALEKLFEDLYLPERDRIYLAVHYLEEDTHF